MQKTRFDAPAVANDPAPTEELFCFGAGADAGKKKPVREATDEELANLAAQASAQIQQFEQIYTQLRIFTQVLAVVQYEQERRRKSAGLHIPGRGAQQ